MKRFISLDFILDIKNYKDSFEKWIKIRSRVVKSDEAEHERLFNHYLQVIKPIIHRFDSGTPVSI